MHAWQTKVTIDGLTDWVALLHCWHGWLVGWLNKTEMRSMNALWIL
jgi:hypothetical protein